MLIENDLFEGKINKITKAIEILKEFEPTEGYYVAFSGGKDSIVILDLIKKSGVKYDAHYNITGVDPPELVRFIKNNYPDVKRDPIKETMWALIERKLMPPTRLARYCCEYLKERNGSGRLIVTGVRRAESTKRSKRKMVEFCFRDKTKRYMNIIIDWSESEVWEYIKKYNLKYCKLYDQGFKRLGCIGCPMAGAKKQKEEFKRWPKFKKLYAKAFKKMIENRIKKGLPCEKWETEKDVFDWWFGDKEKETGQKELNFKYLTDDDFEEIEKKLRKQIKNYDEIIKDITDQSIIFE